VFVVVVVVLVLVVVVVGGGVIYDYIAAFLQPADMFIQLVLMLVAV
jgi:hypothetical protein